MSNRSDSHQDAVADGHPAATGITSQPWWPWARRIATTVFFGLVVWLLAKQAQRIEWDAVWIYLRDMPGGTLAWAGAMVIASFVLYSTFDLLGRYTTGHRLSTANVMVTTFISYVFNLNLGSLVGGIATRYRLYSRLGLDPGTITRVVALSMLTNWLGYLVLAGGVFALWPLDVPDSWKITSAALQVCGWVLLALAAGYLLLCASCHGHHFTVRHHHFSPPSLRIALLQMAMACTNWLLMAGVVFLLLQRQIPLPAVLGVLLVGAVAGVITHVPANLGVLEAVFVALLSHALPETTLLGAVLGYRVLYYLLPLALATAAFVAMEAKARKTPPSSVG